MQQVDGNLTFADTMIWQCIMSRKWQGPRSRKGCAWYYKWASKALMARYILFLSVVLCVAAKRCKTFIFIRCLWFWWRLEARSDFLLRHVNTRFLEHRSCGI